MKKIMFISLVLAGLALAQNRTYPIAGTGQSKCYNESVEITAPLAGHPYYGQDAQQRRTSPSYTNNGNGTITDNVTGLMWTKTPDLNGDGVINTADKLSYKDALAKASTIRVGGYSDWRLPTIKDLYSLIQFSGVDPFLESTDTKSLTPFIDTRYFDFGYGDTAAGERIIDAQFATQTLYVGDTMQGLTGKTMFGVNFADGRIKGYGTGPMPGQSADKTFYVLFVRNNNTYGINLLVDNNDGTISDQATGLMWTKEDNAGGVNWQDALAWVSQKNTQKYLGFSDWRLPTVKELQSIVDYTRSPATTQSAAIDSRFNCSKITNEIGKSDYPFYWSSTTHANMMNGDAAAYVCFGEASGWMEFPPNSGQYNFLDVHGAGAQRSDPKSGDPNNFPHGRGPQGDVIRIYNYVRLVRDISSSTGVYKHTAAPSDFGLEQNYPNPFNPVTRIAFRVPASGHVSITVFDNLGREMAQLVNEVKTAGAYEVEFDGSRLASGVYFYQMRSGAMVTTKKLTPMK
jgi:hypothetical protein